jgi:hypothetical protein
MKTAWCAILISLVSYTFAQKGSAIDNIRKAVERINRDSGYLIKKLSGEEFLESMPDNGGELTGYFKKDKLVKIIEWIGLSSCVIITEYYIQGDKLIFTYTKGSESPYIDSLQRFDPGKLTMTMECRFYFENDKLLKKMTGGSTRCGGQPTATLAKDHLDQYSQYKELLEKK